jgi:DNA-binding FrmR family transcriptional regulator
MINIKDPESKENIKHRLSRIEGQLRRVQKMIDADRDCREILQQLIAIRAGVQSASLSFMQDVARDCLLNADNQANPQAQQDLMNDLIKMIGKVS